MPAAADHEVLLSDWGQSTAMRISTGLHHVPGQKIEKDPRTPGTYQRARLGYRFKSLLVEAQRSALPYSLSRCENNPPPDNAQETTILPGPMTQNAQPRQDALTRLWIVIFCDISGAF